MAEPGNRNLDDIPEALVERPSGRPRLSLVWLVPLVAALIGAWLLYDHLRSRGPVVVIAFKSAEGLDAGKTKIKFKEVQVGVVEEITLSEDLSKVLVKARLGNDMEPYLTEGTRFWVVRARVTATGVSGLGTLFSGAYIAMDPVAEGERRHEFDGLAVPPVVTADSAGKHFRLQAETLGSIQIGSPVYYRQIKAGEVVGYELADDGRGVDLQVFIQDPYADYVHQNTRFWNASGLDVTLDASGMQVETESVVSLVVGGVAFGLPEDAPQSPQAQSDAAFPLFEDRDSAYAQGYSPRVRWLVYFEDSVRGLSKGAPVEFHGIQVGEVASVELVYDTESKQLRIPVAIDIDEGRIDMVGKGEIQSSRELMVAFVERGMRAQLKMASLLTGQLYVDLDFHPEASEASIDRSGVYPELPTLPSGTQQITQDVSKIARRLAEVPFDQIGTDLQSAIERLNSTLAGTEKLVKGFDQEVTPAIKDTLGEARKTLDSAQQLLQVNSPARQDLENMLQELSHAARSLRLLADYLEQHPEALLRGKGAQ